MTGAKRQESVGRTFTWPALLAILTIGALTLGLVEDGIADMLAAIGLAVAPALGLFHVFRRPPTQ